MSSAKTISIRRVTNPSQLPANYSQTPGGTLFGTTPGGKSVISHHHIMNIVMLSCEPNVEFMFVLVVNKQLVYNSR